MGSLYEINERIDALTEQMIDPETGEVDESIMDQIEQLGMEKKQKIEYIALKIKNLRAEAQSLKAEKESFDKRMKQTQNKAESLERYLGNILAGEPFSTTKVKITWRKSESVEIVNAENIPDKYMLCRTEMRPQKALIKQAINEGHAIPGAMVKTNNHMKIE